MENTSKKGLIIIMLFTFFMVAGYEMVMTLVLGHYVNAMGFSATKVAFALAVRLFSQQGLAIAGGILADRFNIKVLMSLGALLRALAFVMLGFSNTFAALLTSMVLVGLGGVLFETPYQTAIAMLTTKENRAHYFAIINTILGIAMTLGPLIGALLLGVDFIFVCLGAAFCFFLNFLIVSMRMPSIKREDKAYTVKSAIKIMSKDNRFLAFFLFNMIFWLAGSQLYVSFPLRIQEISGRTDSIAWMFAVHACITASLQYPLIKLLIRKYSQREIIVIGIFITVIAFLLAPTAKTTLGFLIMVGIFTIGMILTRPNLQNIAVNLANPKIMGMYLGLHAMGFAIGSGVGSIMGGILADKTKASGFENLPWIVYAVIAIIAMIGFISRKSIGAINEE